MIATPEQIERMLAEIVCHDLSEHQAAWLCATVRGLLPALAVARAAVAMKTIATTICETPNAPGPPWASDFDAAQEAYDAALARFADADAKGGST